MIMDEVSLGKSCVIQQNDKWKTGFVWSEFYMWHDTGSSLDAIMVDPRLLRQPMATVEEPEAKRRFKNILDASGIIDHFLQIKPTAAKLEDLLRFHTLDYVQRIKEEF